MSRYSRPHGTSLFIRNLSDHTRPDELRDTFSKYGRLKDVYMPPDYYTGRPRGFAYVQFEEANDAEIALRELDRSKLNGREIEVDFARGDRKAPHEMRRRDRPYRRNDYPRYMSPGNDNYNNYYESRRDRPYHGGGNRYSRSYSRERAVSPVRYRTNHGGSIPRYRSRSRNPPPAMPYSESRVSRHSYRNY